VDEENDKKNEKASSGKHRTDGFILYLSPSILMVPSFLRFCWHLVKISSSVILFQLMLFCNSHVIILNNHVKLINVPGSLHQCLVSFL
jgi:hypothetical protein